MDRPILILGLVMLAAFVAITWIAPRRYGFGGLVAVHLIVFVSYFVFAGVSLSAGVYEYDGAPSMLGLALHVLLLNCLLLPVGIVALRIRRRASRT